MKTTQQQNTILDELALAGENLRQADKDFREWVAEMRTAKLAEHQFKIQNLAIEADKIHTPRLRIARAAGISTNKLYDMLKEGDGYMSKEMIKIEKIKRERHETLREALDMEDETEGGF